MITSCHQNSGQNQNVRIANELFENVAKFRYLGITLTNHNDINDEINGILNSRNACYNSVQSFFVFPSHVKKLKMKIYKTIILPVVLYGCENWFLTLREECRLRVFESRVLRRTFEPKREEDRSWRKLDNDELHDLYSSPNIVKVTEYEVGGTYSTHGGGEKCLQGFGQEARREETTGKT
jgi:hypothetical protein